MKKYMKKLFGAICMTLIMYSCTFNDSDLEIESYFFDTKNTTWVYNKNYNRYECVFNFPELTSAKYENGSHNGYVFINEIATNGNAIEVQKPLPFSQTVISLSGYLHTETINYDLSFGSPSTVCFYIQTSDLKDVFLRDYQFKITIVHDRDF